MIDFNTVVNSLTDHILSVVQQETTPVLFLTGEVIQINPLRIKISTQMILEEDSLLLSATVKETWIDLPTTPEDESSGVDDVFMHRHQIDAETEMADDGHGAHKHAIKVSTKFALPRIRLWRGLQVGDIVRLLKVQEGQFYFVLEREERISNENIVEETK